MNMVDKIAEIWPEITLLTGAVACLLVGLSPEVAIRRMTVWIAAISLIVAGVFVCAGISATQSVTGVAPFIKLAVVVIGLILLMVAAAVPDQLKMTRDAEAGREPFDAGLVMRGEFFAFFLFSLTGVMLTAGASDLVWLFLALELTSLPTYVMVATSRDRAEAQESGVKYFFLGAMAAAVFLYGFTLIYGATGQTDFALIRESVFAQLNEQGSLPPLFILGLVLSLVGVAFKIAAVPMHFYAADVYQGATTAVTAFLAFVPKTAGFVAMIALLSLVPAELESPAITALLWIMAVLTMTVGNVLGLIQNNVKRVLAYSSIAHSGYMLVGLLALHGSGGEAIGSGLAAILFYLVAYGLATIGAFAVLGSLQVRGEEAETYEDISGLVRSRPALAALMLLSVLSLIGLPPMVGFLGKIYLFGSAIQHGHTTLVVIAVLNSAISAVYYLRIASACFFGEPSGQVTSVPGVARPIAAAIASIAAVVLGFAGGRLVDAARDAAVYEDRNVTASAPSQESHASASR